VISLESGANSLESEKSSELMTLDFGTKSALGIGSGYRPVANACAV